MKEITRIHIAKIPYDVEITAKKDLEIYIKQLESFADSEDWVEDIEIRITELLLERGIAKNDLITTTDVEAIKSQLGQPEDFAQEGEEVVEIEDEDASVRRRLYRDLDEAVLGGVLSGVGKFFGINPGWIRLLFIILLLSSFGTVTIVYLVMWLAIPAARTAAEKLQQEGKPVTLASIKKLRADSEVATPVNKTASTLQSIIIYGLGTLSILGAAASLLATVVAGFLIGTTLLNPNGLVMNPPMLYSSWEMWLAYILFVISGLLLTTLFSLVAIALFKRQLSKGVVIALIVVMVSGMISFGLGATSLFYGAHRQSNYISESQKTTSRDLPAEYSNLTGLAIEAKDSNQGIFDYRVEYIVSSEQPRYELVTDATTSKTIPIFKLSEDGKSGTLTITRDSSGDNRNFFHHPNHPLVRIYGPELTEIAAKGVSVDYSNSEQQDSLSIRATNGHISLDGRVDNVSAEVNDSADLNLSGATVKNLTANITEGYIGAGSITNLNVTHPTACPAGTYINTNNNIDIESITSGRMTINGIEQTARDIEQSCIEIDIDNDHLDSESNQED